MNVRIITCHNVYNHGASLQAYALYKWISALGHDVMHIDYRPLPSPYKISGVYNPKFDRPVLKQLYLAIKFIPRLRKRKRMHEFDKFTRQFLRLTTPTLLSRKQLMSNVPEADLYIAGSDQIWNPFLPNGNDPSFFLHEFPSSSRRITYAASMPATVSRSYLEHIMPWLEALDEISVRERSSVNNIMSVSCDKIKPILVCDPVLLLSADEWEKIIPPYTPLDGKKYILVYECERSPLLRSFASKLKKETNIPIVTISTPFKDCNYDFSLKGPLDFLALIKRAAYVVSDSYHATLFSVIFKRNFYVVPREQEIFNSRITDFLNTTGLTDRIVKSLNMTISDDISYTSLTKSSILLWMIQKDIY